MFEFETLAKGIADGARKEVYNKTWLGNPDLKKSPEDVETFIKIYGLMTSKIDAIKTLIGEIEPDTIPSLDDFTQKLYSDFRTIMDELTEAN